jgi:hypothetical protein
LLLAYARHPTLSQVRSPDILHGGANRTRCQLRVVLLATVCMPESQLSRSSYQMLGRHIRTRVSDLMMLSLDKRFRACEVPSFFVSVSPTLRRSSRRLLVSPTPTLAHLKLKTCSPLLLPRKLNNSYHAFLINHVQNWQEIIRIRLSMWLEKEHTLRNSYYIPRDVWFLRLWKLSPSSR